MRSQEREEGLDEYYERREGKRRRRELKLLLLDSDGDLMKSYLEIELGCIIDLERDAETAALQRDPLDYNMAVIDASGDMVIDNHHTFSEWLKLRNPNIIIMGTSFAGKYFRSDQEAKQVYDARLYTHGSFGEQAHNIRLLFEKYGFEFREVIRERELRS